MANRDMHLRGIVHYRGIHYIGVCGARPRYILQRVRCKFDDWTEDIIRRTPMQALDSVPTDRNVALRLRGRDASSEAIIYGPRCVRRLQDLSPDSRVTWMVVEFDDRVWFTHINHVAAV